MDALQEELLVMILERTQNLGSCFLVNHQWRDLCRSGLSEFVFDCGRLSDAESVIGQVISRSKNGVRKLKILEGCGFVCPEELLKNMKSAGSTLEVLDTDVGFDVQNLFHFQKLKHLLLSGLEIKVQPLVGTSWKYMKNCELSGCEFSSDSDLQALVASCPVLKELSLSYWLHRPEIRSTSLEDIVFLQEDEGVERLYMEVPHLQCLDVYLSPNALLPCVVHLLGPKCLEKLFLAQVEDFRAPGLSRVEDLYFYGKGTDEKVRVLTSQLAAAAVGRLEVEMAVGLCNFLPVLTGCKELELSASMFEQCVKEGGVANLPLLPCLTRLIILQESLNEGMNKHIGWFTSFEEQCQSLSRIVLKYKNSCSFRVCKLQKSLRHTTVRIHEGFN